MKFADQKVLFPPTPVVVSRALDIREFQKKNQKSLNYFYKYLGFVCFIIIIVIFEIVNSITMHFHEPRFILVDPDVHNYNYVLLQDSETPFEMNIK